MVLNLLKQLKSIYQRTSNSPSFIAGMNAERGRGDSFFPFSQKPPFKAGMLNTIKVKKMTMRSIITLKHTIKKN